MVRGYLYDVQRCKDTKSYYSYYYLLEYVGIQYIKNPAKIHGAWLLFVFIKSMKLVLEDYYEENQEV